MKNRTDLNLGEVFFRLSISHIPDFSLDLFNVYDLQFLWCAILYGVVLRVYRRQIVL